jgi:AraC family transcriptional regulator of adaptative response/methylated-DNA-[protein]-cysteine methyltransferase
MLYMPDPPSATGDYVTVKRAVEFISKRYRDQPSIEAIAEHVGLSASHFQHVFKRWAGLTPKAFLQARAGCMTCSSPTRRWPPVTIAATT